ncbi:hypothetical protein ACI797_19670 [Geodermatophilus sp. SYSU D00691]
MPGPEDMMSAVTDSMAERTGRGLDEWVALVGTSGIDPLDQNAVRRWVKDVHGVEQNSQWTIADAAARAAGWERPPVEQHVDGQCTGARAGLRPVFDAVRAATATRLDHGLRYVDPPASDRLRPAEAPGQATHEVSLDSPDDVDGEVRVLLRAACEQNG